jgi:hypothetical protein
LPSGVGGMRVDDRRTELIGMGSGVGVVESIRGVNIDRVSKLARFGSIVSVSEVAGEGLGILGEGARGSTVESP